MAHRIAHGGFGALALALVLFATVAPLPLGSQVEARKKHDRKVDVAIQSI